MIDSYINEREFSMIYKNNKLDVINYTEMLDFSDVKISVKYKDKVYHIEGNNLVISRMIDNEVLISGDIKTITFL
ncbi:MAG: YabP/YqfC family sporulation protein [Bacilli bacterium]